MGAEIDNLDAPESLATTGTLACVARQAATFCPLWTEGHWSGLWEFLGTRKQVGRLEFPSAIVSFHIFYFV